MTIIQEIENFSKTMDSQKILSTISKVRKIESATITWSQLPSEEFLPFKIMLSGIRPDEPKLKLRNKNNAFEYHFDSQGNLFLINSYGKKGVIEWSEYIDIENNISVEVDKYDDVLGYTLVNIKNNKAVSSIYISDNNRTYYEYNYKNNNLSSITSYASLNGFLENNIFLEKEGLEVINLYYFFNNKKTYLID